MTNLESPPQSMAPTIEQSFQQAVAYHQAGRAQDAERFYRAVLQADPKHAEANHNLGILAVQARQPAASLPHFKAALEANPNQGQFWLSYMNALIQAGQLDVARKTFAQVRQMGLRGEAMDALAGVLERPSGKEPAPREVGELMALFSSGQLAQAAAAAQAMTLRFPLHGTGWMALGMVYGQMGRIEEALAPMQKAAALLPDDAEAHYNLCVTLRKLGRAAEAEASCRRALEINPDFAMAHCNLGDFLQDLGRLPEAEASFRRALAIEPNFAQAHNNLGGNLQEQDRLAEAEASYRRALQIDPEYALAHRNLGEILNDMGRPDEAEASYRRAIQVKPDFGDALDDLALMLNSQGKSMDALEFARKSMQVKETEKARSIFVGCVKRVRWTSDTGGIRTDMVRALAEAWDWPNTLARVSADLVKLDPVIGSCIELAAGKWPQHLPAGELFGSNGLAALAADPLLHALLTSAPICSLEMERFLTMARRAMLDTAIGMPASDAGPGEALDFYGALASQCFINEYVFSHTADEIRGAGELRDSLVAALDAGTQVSALVPLAVAAYFPLHSLPLASRLMDMQWPEAVTAVLARQVREPAEEVQLRAAMPRLTRIDDAVSLLVQNQYEENPYPRWVKAAPAGNEIDIAGILRRKFPLLSFERHGESGNLDVLIAGCGTGQNSIQTAQRFQGWAKVLAIDLSMSSLGYAGRKTRELGLDSIEYAQADILELGSIGREFHVIESSGVLHHLADPWAGWRVLLSLLRPGGFMKISLYSEVARRNIVKAQAWIAGRGYGTTADDIRRCRQDLVASDESMDFGNTTTVFDFFTTSTCRDLLFHVQEHRMTLTGIDEFLRQNSLKFQGFEIEADILQAYKRRFPGDRAAVDLGQWQAFENENPDIFLGMYQFWIQKAG